jgi:hypothetical protein
MVNAQIMSHAVGMGTTLPKAMGNWVYNHPFGTLGIVASGAALPVGAVSLTGGALLGATGMITTGVDGYLTDHTPMPPPQ